jgi:hypothetical protein
MRQKTSGRVLPVDIFITIAVLKHDLHLNQFRSNSVPALSYDFDELSQILASLVWVLTYAVICGQNISLVKNVTQVFVLF